MSVSLPLSSPFVAGAAIGAADATAGNLVADAGAGAGGAGPRFACSAASCICFCCDDRIVSCITRFEGMEIRTTSSGAGDFRPSVAAAAAENDLLELARLAAADGASEPAPSAGASVAYGSI